jgi:rhodanese-related sulfurtransferase/rubrerythrin
MEEEEPLLFDSTPTMTVHEVKQFLLEHDPGTYNLVDVRQPVEYEEVHIPGAKLLPLPELMKALPDLDRAKPTILYCSAGGRSRVAAQLLKGQGFKQAFNMAGGIFNWEGLEAVGPQELNMDLVRGDESPGEMIALAYGMEDGLLHFYERASARGGNAKVVELLTTLSRVEERHKEKLRRLYADLQPEGPALGSAASDRETDIMEGGFRIGEFMEQNEPFMDDGERILEMAIMLESQALDLYLRFADKMHLEATREVLLAIAQEENGHLVHLGRLYDEIS